MNPSLLPPPPSERRLKGIAATVLVHAALLFAWQMAQRMPAPEPEAAQSFVQWLRLPAEVRPQTAAAPTPPVRDTSRKGAARSSATGKVDAPPPSAAAVPDAGAMTVLPPAPEAAQPETPSPGRARQLLEEAKRRAGAVDRALRKENNPYIVAPLDSPQIRMRRGIAQAAAMAPNKLWEAPKVEELVNDTGDGARRSRVITGGGSYCVTERSTATSIDMIEKHGKLRITNCGSGHEQPANAQEWRTARD